MKNSLQNLIREAFNTAYHNHKAKKTISILKESSEHLAKLLTPEQKTQAEQVLNIMITQKPGWEKYQWDPSGKVNGVSQQQWNYIVEKILELYQATGDDKYKNILGNAYTFARKTTGVGEEAHTTNSALYNSIIGPLLANTALERLQAQDPDFLYTVLSRVWGRIFAGGKIDPKAGKYAGQTNVDAWKKIVDDYLSSEKSNFGAYLREIIFKDVRDLIKVEMDKGSTISLDKPNKTGKSSDIGDEDESGIEDIRQGEEFGDEENIEGGDEATHGYENITADADTEKQKRAAEKVKKFQKAVSDIVHASKTLGIKNETGLLALQEMGLNFLSYEEIAAKYPDLFKEKETQNVDAIKSILKNKNLIKISNEVLSKYIQNPESVTEAKKEVDFGLYNIFSEPNWQEKYNLGPEVVEEIIKIFKEKVSADTTLKNKYTNIFREYALNHLTPEQIADNLSDITKKIRGSGESSLTKYGAGANLVKSALYNLGKNNRFIALADSILRENGFNIDFEEINWSDFAKAGKAMIDAELAKEPEVNNIGNDTEEKYVWENFIAENLDKIIERVYKRLEKRL